MDLQRRAALHVFHTSDLGTPAGSAVKNLPAVQEARVGSLGLEDPLEKEIATHSGKSHGRRSLVSYRFMGSRESDTT